MDKKLAYTIAKFLRYSFRPIEYSYEKLTNEEKNLCTKEEYEALVAWIKAQP